MPIYEFYCDQCNVVFNFLSSKVNTTKKPDCPRCGKPELTKKISTFATIGRAKEDPDLHLSNKEFKEMLDFIAGRRKENAMDVKFSCEGYVGAYEAKVRDTPFFCRAGINIGSILIDGSISACPNIDRSFTQGNIYRDNFHRIWNRKFTPFRDRSWTRKGMCSACKDYSDCQGNGFHNWHGDMLNPLVCHKGKLEGIN